MDDTEDIYFQKIQTLFHDEDKIITASFLSSTLSVPIYVSKNLMKRFVNDLTQHEKIHKTHMLMGTLCGGKGFSICITKDEELADKKNLFETITSEEIYSIQKCADIDLNALTYIEFTDKIFQEKTHGLVTGPNCVKVEHTIKHTAILNECSLRQEETSKSSKENETEFKEKKNVSSSGASIKTLFAKIPAKVSKSDAEHDKAKEVSLKNNYSNDKRDKSHQNSNVEIKTKNNESVHVEQKESNKKKRPRSDNSEQKKKRKRIIQRDSDSDDLFESDKEDLEDVNNLDEEQEAVFKTDDLNSSNKAKVLKYINNTYEDEGFIVTKREAVVVSDSEEENKLPENKKIEQKPNSESNKIINDNSLKQTQKKNSKKAKTEISSKQQTLTNFFKKK